MIDNFRTLIFGFPLETCRCKKRLSTNWKEFPPYVSLQDGKVAGIFPSVLEQVAVSCCGSCASHGKSYVDFRFNGMNKAAQQLIDKDFKSNISHKTDLSFPAYGYTWQETYATSYGYKSIIESPGVAFVVNTEKDSSSTKSPIVFSLVASLPILACTVILIYAAGVIIWLMVSIDGYNNEFHSWLRKAQ